MLLLSIITGSISRCKIPLILVLTIVVIRSHAFSIERKFQLDVVLEKEQYVIGEPVPISITVTNISMSPIEFWYILVPNHIGRSFVFSTPKSWKERYPPGSNNIIHNSGRSIIYIDSTTFICRSICNCKSSKG